MPGLLDFTLQQGRQAGTLGEEAARAGADVAMRRSAEKYGAQTGLGQLVGTVVGTKLGKRDALNLSPETMRMLGTVSQHLFNHWLPQHSVPEYMPPQAAPEPDPMQMSPDTGFETTPQEGQE